MSLFWRTAVAFLAYPDPGQVRLEDVGQEPVEGLDGVRGAQQVVVHVAEVRSLRSVTPARAGRPGVARAWPTGARRAELGDPRLSLWMRLVWSSSAPPKTWDSISPTSSVMPLTACSYWSTTRSAARYSTPSGPRPGRSPAPVSSCTPTSATSGGRERATPGLTRWLGVTDIRHRARESPGGRRVELRAWRNSSCRGDVRGAGRDHRRVSGRFGFVAQADGTASRREEGPPLPLEPTPLQSK